MLITARIRTWLSLPALLALGLLSACADTPAQPATPSAGVVIVAAATAGPILEPTATPRPTVTPTPTPVPITTPPKQPSLALLTNRERVDSGLLIAASAAEAAGKAGQAFTHLPVAQAEIERSGRELALAGYSVVLIAAYEEEAALRLGKEFPATRFLFFGSAPEEAPPNLTGLDFAEDEAGFLAGCLAGWVSKNDKVGFVGSAPALDTVRLRKGYERGVHYVSRKAIVMGSYIEDGDIEKAAVSQARDQASEGADVLFTGGGQTADAVLAYAAQAGLAVIAAVTDPYDDHPELSGVLVGSALIYYERGVAAAIQQLAGGALPAGKTIHFNAANGMIAPGPYHLWEERLPADAKAELKAIYEGLRKGEIKTGVVVPRY